ncbi:cytidine deaminase [Candidatus Woesearchaeota archaeon]|nr:cytidine deaminase [Candidatus Woesearchaeota archaeon]
MKLISFDRLNEGERALVEAAERVRENAYNPYSHFYVGAALLGQDGRIITGANVENASYGLTICAERSALAAANATGVRMLESIALSTRAEESDTEEPTMPCGACLQFLVEFGQISGRDIQIVSATTRRDQIRVATVSEILTLSFGPKDLGVDITRYQR